MLISAHPAGSSFVVEVGGTRLAAGTRYRWSYGPLKQ